MINPEVDLKFFPAAPVDKDVTNRVGISILNTAEDEPWSLIHDLLSKSVQNSWVRGILLGECILFMLFFSPVGFILSSGYQSKTRLFQLFDAI